MFLLWQYTGDPTSFEPCEAFHFGVPTGKLAFEKASRMNVIRRSFAVNSGVDVDSSSLQLAPILDVVFGEMVGTMRVRVQEIHDVTRIMG